MRSSVSSPDETLHWEESWKCDSQRSIFDELQGVSSGDETLCRMLDITSQTMIWEEIKDLKMSSFFIWLPNTH